MKRLLVLSLVLVVGISLLGLAAGKVAIVLDVGGRGDLSFNDMGFKGTDEAAEEFGLTMVEVQSASGNDYLPNFRNLARTGEYDLIIGVGFLLGDALGTVAAEYPNQKFAIIDVGYITGPNIANYVFKENEMSALIGALNAMVALQEGYQAAGVVLGIPISVLLHFEAGYRFGMDWGIKKYGEITGVTETVTMLYSYTGTFSDIALGKAASEAMLAQGAVGIYNVAGPLGVGDLEAVTEYHDNYGTPSGAPYYFGVDANQDWMGMAQHTLASGMKRVDFATYSAVKSVVEGTFTAGVTVLDLAGGGVGISKAADLDTFIDFGIKGGAITEADRATIVANWTVNRAAVPAFIWDAIDELEAGIIDGTIAVPTADSDAEIAALRVEYPLE